MVMHTGKDDLKVHFLDSKPSGDVTSCNVVKAIFIQKLKQEFCLEEMHLISKIVGKITHIG